MAVVVIKHLTGLCNIFPCADFVYFDVVSVWK